ncbi:DUF3025 domain-containing protein [Chitinimonas arctica]|uniref:DUF3025 domain-containing protein n=1 Tax=Chitinimonas arctica TaxID=2594795 RepID=A0A516SH40_9NEIS|nr:DUF3025 domain-containing protein [Chitinimonas arctica]QDQ27465.1 DUF3025 domain-containing protein [Chitinimonas arctica]
MQPWPSAHLADSPWLRSLQPILQQLAWTHFPAESDWLDLPSPLRPFNNNGNAIHFVAPDQLADEGYEARIAGSGQVATRPDNWHDAFNALCWLAWPRSKAALNALHMRELAAQTDSRRNRCRDAATLFDESGLVLAVADASLAQALLDHDWHTLFQARRADWGGLLEPFCFGHALMEKSLAPFKGIVAKVMLLPVERDWFVQPLADKLAQLDGRLAERIAQGELRDPRALPPLPVLGIPGWWPAQGPDFYADRQHFRPRAAVVHPR